MLDPAIYSVPVDIPLVSSNFPPINISAVNCNSLNMATVTFFFLRQPWPTVAFIFTNFTLTGSQDNIKHNEELFTLRLQYCAWGTPSALSYYSIRH
jgi:hypothetical protein